MQFRWEECSPIRPGLTINNNVYFANGAGGVFGRFNSANVADLTAWRAAVGQDANSFSTDPLFINLTNAIPNLHLQASNPESGAGSRRLQSVTNDLTVMHGRTRQEQVRTLVRTKLIFGLIGRSASN